MGASSNEIRAGGAFVEVNADTGQAKKNLTGFGAALQDLKKGLGEESKFGGLFKILAGTGAVAGLALASRLLGDMTSKAVELADAYHAGQKSAGDVTEELIQSLPILGDIRKAGLSIREMFDGEARAVREMTADAEKLNASVDARRKLLEETNRQWERQRDILAGLADQMQLIGKRGLDVQVQTARNAAAEKERGFHQSAADDIAKLKEAAAKDPTGKASQDLKKNIAQREGTLTSEVQANAILLQDQINQLYAQEADRLREANAEGEQRTQNLKDQTAAIQAQTQAAMALTDADRAQIERVQEWNEIQQELAESLQKSTSAAEANAAQQLADAKNAASAQRGAAAQLEAIFGPIEADFESLGGRLTKQLDDFFGPIEDAYDGMKHAASESPQGTFSAAVASSFGSDPAAQTAANTRELVRLARRGGGLVFT